MLIHPEVYAWLNRQNRVERDETKPRPLVSRSEKINKGGPEKAKQVAIYDTDDDDSERGEVEYLNDRRSNLNFYA
ncbi:MAG: hypothetical protein LBV79_03430 [Candidatus Adiutrix sp.]|jgi:hypothetical protein|nr:hypothetical protein [Candidatus Adiutrix sp.]